MWASGVQSLLHVVVHSHDLPMLAPKIANRAILLVFLTTSLLRIGIVRVEDGWIARTVDGRSEVVDWEEQPLALALH